jgi:DNA-binding LacI/PurR family transcriptional regulator
MSALEELSCGLCDDVLIIGARFPLNIDRPDVALIDCLESEGVNNIQFDHAFAAETACNYLISQGRRQIALIHPEGSGFADQVLLGYKHALEKISCRLIATWYSSTAPRRRWRCRSW